MRLVSSLVVLGLLVPGPVSATMMTNSGKQSPGDNDGQVAPPGNNGQNQWTEERMRKAKPMPLPRVDPKRDKRD
jgi:hypothetical protein